MTTPTTAELLKYANLQMAAEALLTNEDGTLKSDLQKALTEGNLHNSKFTAVQEQQDRRNRPLHPLHRIHRRRSP